MSDDTNDTPDDDFLIESAERSRHFSGKDARRFLAMERGSEEDEPEFGYRYCGLCGDELQNDLDLDTGICSACAKVNAPDPDQVIDQSQPHSDQDQGGNGE